MRFKKIYIKEVTKTTFIVTIKEKPEYEIYFTTDEGFSNINPLLDEIVTFKELPTPLLKQIK